MTQTGSGGLWAHSGTLSITSSNGSMPGPLVLNNIYLDSTGITVGTASGSLSFGHSIPGVSRRADPLMPGCGRHPGTAEPPASKVVTGQSLSVNAGRAGGR